MCCSQGRTASRKVPVSTLPYPNPSAQKLNAYFRSKGSKKEPYFSVKLITCRKFNHCGEGGILQVRTLTTIYIGLGLIEAAPYSPLCLA